MLLALPCLTQPKLQLYKLMEAMEVITVLAEMNF
jgi:hypothetical protein